MRKTSLFIAVVALFAPTLGVAQSFDKSGYSNLSSEATVGTGIGHIGDPDMGTVWSNGKVDLHWSAICQVASRVGGDEYMVADQNIAHALIAARRKKCTTEELNIPTTTWP